MEEPLRWSGAPVVGCLLNFRNPGLPRSKHLIALYSSDSKPFCNDGKSIVVSDHPTQEAEIESHHFSVSRKSVTNFLDMLLLVEDLS